MALRRTAHRTIRGATSPDADHNVLRGREEKNGTVHDDCRRAASDAARHRGLVKKPVEEQREVYILGNNRSEGNAPLTIQALRNALQAAET